MCMVTLNACVLLHARLSRRVLPHLTVCEMRVRSVKKWYTLSRIIMHALQRVCVCIVSAVSDDDDKAAASQQQYQGANFQVVHLSVDGGGCDGRRRQQEVRASVIHAAAPLAYVHIISVRLFLILSKSFTRVGVCECVCVCCMMCASHVRTRGTKRDTYAHAVLGAPREKRVLLRSRPHYHYLLFVYIYTYILHWFAWTWNTRTRSFIAAKPRVKLDIVRSGSGCGVCDLCAMRHVVRL